LRGSPSDTAARIGRRMLVQLLVLLVVLATAGCGTAEQPTTEPEPAAETVEVKVFFTNDQLGDPCGQAFAVTRTVDADDPVTGALEALLAGPTTAERADGYGGWFSDATAGMLHDVTVDTDGTAHVVFADLRPVIPNASTSCGSAALLAQLDQTLLAFDHIHAARYALADQAAFYEWLQLVDPDAAGPDEQAIETTEPPEPEETTPDEPTEEQTEPSASGTENAEPEPSKPTVDLEAGWTLVDDFVWPVQPNCCSIADTGLASPPGSLDEGGWSGDGFFSVDVDRREETPSLLRLTVHPWVACAERPDLGCGDLPDGEEADTRIVPDPAVEAVVDVAVDDVGVVLAPIHDVSAGQQLQALEGEPGALARLLSHGIDPAFRTWVIDPLRDGMTESMVWADIIERSADPTFPFGRPDCPEDGGCGPVSYRGPFGTLLLANPSRSDTDLGDWPPGYNGLYAWRAVTLEIRDDQPILYLWAGQLAG
jgi:hypothetical protein